MQRITPATSPDPSALGKLLRKTWCVTGSTLWKKIWPPILNYTGPFLTIQGNFLKNKGFLKGQTLEVLAAPMPKKAAPSVISSLRILSPS